MLKADPRKWISSPTLLPPLGHLAVTFAFAASLLVPSRLSANTVYNFPFDQWTLVNAVNYPHNYVFYKYESPQDVAIFYFLTAAQTPPTISPSGIAFTLQAP